MGQARLRVEEDVGGGLEDNGAGGDRGLGQRGGKRGWRVWSRKRRLSEGIERRRSFEKEGIITETCFRLLSSSLTFENPSSTSFCAAFSYAWITDARAAARLRPSSVNASGSSAESLPFGDDGAPIEGAAAEEALLLKAEAFVGPRHCWGKGELRTPPDVEKTAGRRAPAVRRPREGTPTIAAEAAATRTRARVQGLVAAGIVCDASLASIEPGGVSGRG